MVRKAWVALGVVLLGASLAVGGEGKEERSLDGTWVPSAAELGGKAFPEEARKAIKLVIDGEKYTVTEGKAVDRGTVKVNGAARPRELDTVGKEGPNKGRTILAIYQKEGETLRVCYDLSGKGRPSEFKTVEGGLLFLVTYKREKPYELLTEFTAETQRSQRNQDE